jgi:hypothetical protein
MVRAGGPEKAAMRISGHKTRSVFEPCDIARDRELADAAAELEQHVASLRMPASY